MVLSTAIKTHTELGQRNNCWWICQISHFALAIFLLMHTLKCSCQVLASLWQKWPVIACAQLYMQLLHVLQIVSTKAKSNSNLKAPLLLKVHM